MTGAQSSERVTLAPNGWPDAKRPGFPRNPEQDSEGHVIRMDGEAMCDVYKWSAGHQWFEDDGGRWCAPCDLVKDGDYYLGQIAALSTPATTGEGEVGRLKADLKDEINFDLNTRVNKVPESVVDQVVDLLAARNLLALAALPPSSGWEAGAEAMKRAAVAMLRSRHKGAEHLREYAEAQYAALQIEETLPLPPPPSSEGA